MASPIIGGLLQGFGKGLQDAGKYQFEEEQTRSRMKHEEDITRIKADLDLRRDKIMNDLRQKGAESLKQMEITSSEKIAEGSQAISKSQVEEQKRHNQSVEAFNRRKLELDIQLRDEIRKDRVSKEEAMRYQAQGAQLQRQVENVVKQMGETRDPNERAGLALRKAEYEARMDEVQAQATKSNDKSERREDLTRFNDLLAKFAAYGATETGARIKNYPMSERDISEFNALASKLGLGKESRLSAKSGFFGTDESAGKGKVVLDEKGKALIDNLITMQRGSGEAPARPAEAKQTNGSPPPVDTGVRPPSMSSGAKGLIGGQNPAMERIALDQEMSQLRDAATRTADIESKQAISERMAAITRRLQELGVQ